MLGRRTERTGRMEITDGPGKRPAGHEGHGLTRRGFLRATAASGTTVAAVGLLSGCTHTQEDPTPEPTVVDEDSATSVTDSYSYVDPTMEATSVWTLPLGNVLHPAEGSWIPVTTAGASAYPMVKGSALSLVSGQLSEVVPTPISTATTRVIYDARCSDQVYAWVELDTATRDWCLYASAFSEGALTGETKKLWEANADYDPAPIACSGNKVFWQVQPAKSGSKTTEHSFCYLWKSGGSDAQAVVESPGRFATKPSVSGANLILTPRVRADEGTYYGVTAYSMGDDLATVVDQLVMPQSVRPFKATRVGERFVVSVEASYSSGGLLGQMGTYIGRSSGDDFVRLSREPSEVTCGKDGTFLVKSRSSYFVINVDDKTYTGLSAFDRSLDYGEYPAREGECTSFVTFSSVKDATTGYPASVAVRAFEL